MSQLLDKHQQRSMEPRLLRQLLQAAALAQAAGVPVSLPETVEKAAAKWWRTTATAVPSLSHEGVSHTLKRLGVKHRVLVFLREGLPTVDIAVEAWADQQKVAIQVRPVLFPLHVVPGCCLPIKNSLPIAEDVKCLFLMPSVCCAF